MISDPSIVIALSSASHMAGSGSPIDEAAGGQIQRRSKVENEPQHGGETYILVAGLVDVKSLERWTGVEGYDMISRTYAKADSRRTNIHVRISIGDGTRVKRFPSIENSNLRRWTDHCLCACCPGSPRLVPFGCKRSGKVEKLVKVEGDADVAFYYLRDGLPSSGEF